MNPDEFERILEAVARDGKLSRAEAAALRDRLRDEALDVAELRRLRQQLFLAARGSLVDPGGKAALGWVEEVVEVLDKARPPRAVSSRLGEVLFTPHDDVVGRLRSLIKRAGRTLDVCVYTITDNRLARPIRDAHRRGVSVRIVTECSKIDALGSDIEFLADAGIPVKMDSEAFALMHHKFALFDSAVVATGSYNWTRGAAEENWENLIVTDDERLVGPFAKEFERLWSGL
jgi:phosphatidylserine/phosphatidylglycerophosphate/cardiolipin synthase-like enzyme